MARSPIMTLAIILTVLAFEGLIFGQSIAERSFPTFEEPTSTGFWGAFEAALAFVKAVWGVVVFLFNLITVNVPGSPWWIRLPVGGILGGGLIWSIAQLLRRG